MKLSTLQFEAVYCILAKQLNDKYQKQYDELIKKHSDKISKELEKFKKSFNSFSEKEQEVLLFSVYSGSRNKKTVLFENFENKLKREVTKNLQQPDLKALRNAIHIASIDSETYGQLSDKLGLNFK